nr:PilZ domain-containing protein [Sphingomonas jejuensis]
MLLIATLSGAALAGEIKARVRNLSAGGMMVESDKVLARGVAVVADLPRIGEVTATVAWCAGGRIGFMFDRAIDPRQARRPVGGGEGSPVYAKSLTVGPRALRTR